MGTWGVGYFENDDALDFIAELEELSDPEPRIAELFAESKSDEYLEAPIAAQLVAVIAVILGKNAKHQIKSSVPKSAMIEACKMVRGSELAELWEDSDEYNLAWVNGIQKLEQELEAL